MNRINSRIFGFRYRYPKKFLDDLAKSLGIKWQKVKVRLMDKDKIESRPLRPPMGKFYYMDMRYNDNDNDL